MTIVEIMMAQEYMPRRPAFNPMADAEPEFICPACGSSVYNTKQMSRLIDHVVQDCKAVGIETLTPLELDRLKGDWKPHEE